MFCVICSKVWFKNRRAKWRKQKREEEARRRADSNSQVTVGDKVQERLGGVHSSNSSLQADKRVTTEDKRPTNHIKKTTCSSQLDDILDDNSKCSDLSDDSSN